MDPGVARWHVDKGNTRLFLRISHWATFSSGKWTSDKLEFKRAREIERERAIEREMKAQLSRGLSGGEREKRFAR